MNVLREHQVKEAQKVDGGMLKPIGLKSRILYYSILYYYIFYSILLIVTIPRAKAMQESMESIDAKPFISLPSAETYPILIVASGFKLVIPRNYLETAQIFMGKSVIGMETMFPKFSGADHENMKCFNTANNFICPNIILIRRTHFDQSAYELSNRRHIESAIKKNDIHKEYGLTKLDVLGADIRVGLLSPIEDSVVISCWLPGDNPVRCTTAIDLAPGLAFSYEYDQSLIPEWRRVNEGVKTLLQKFFKGEN